MKNQLLAALFFAGALLLQGAPGSVLVTVNATAMPWLWSASLNASSQFGAQDGTPPAVVDATSGVAITPGTQITITRIAGLTNNYYGGTPVADGIGYGPNSPSPYVANNGVVNSFHFPSLYMNPASYPIYANELVATFADATGKIVGTPFSIGNGPTTVTVPAGASRLQLGINDTYFWDNSGSLSVLVAAPSVSLYTTTWIGTLTQGGTVFPFQMNLSETASGQVSGTSLIELPGQPQYFALESLTGSFTGSVLNFQENAFLAQNASGFGWCVKSGQLTRDATGFTLSGPWQAGVCDPGTINLTRGAACSYGLSALSANPGPVATTSTVSVNTGTACPWTASTSDSFIHIDTGTPGLGPGIVNYHVDANPSNVPRSGSIVIAGTLFPITQASAVCSASFAPQSLNVASPAGINSMTLSIGSNCSWSASSDSWWLTLAGVSSGIGPATLSFHAASNAQTTTRAGNITVNGTKFGVFQAGGSLPYNNREVTLLYQCFLNREPDSGGLGYWSGQPPQQLGAAFYLSNEFQAVQLNLVQLYRVFYGREPDYNTEYLPGVVALRTGAITVSGLAAQLVASSGNPSTAKLVQTMCNNVNFGATQSAVSACIAANAGLLSLAPADAALQFIRSSSYQGVQSAQRDAVYLMYTITLTRPPDPSGFGYWLTTMSQNNYDNLWLVTAFVISTEFQNRLN
jgi:hypothetical protein